MPYIEIVEKDETSAGTLAEVTDVVYVPGFVDISQDCLYVDGKYVGIEANKPTLFTSVKQFESLCGKRGAIFESDQLYTDLQEKLAGGGYSGFASNAIPYHKVMFSAGMTDPSYAMAKEYLNAGLNVLYERMNGDSELVQIDEEPKDWTDTYNKYYSTQEVYTLIGDTTPPVWYKEAIAGSKVEEDVTYFVASEDEETKEIISFTKADIQSAVIPEGDTERYFTQTKHYYSMSYEKVPVSDEAPEWEENKYFREDKDVNTGETVMVSVERSGDFKTKYGDYFVKVYTDITVDAEDGCLTVVPDNWAKVYFKHYEKAFKTLPIPERENAPAFTPVFKLSTGVNIKNMYAALDGAFDSGKIDGLTDKGNYSIKYLTSGGYPVYEYNDNAITTKMIALAVERGDCVAFIDHTDHPGRDGNIDHVGSVYKTVSEDQVFKANGDFATMFTPWAEYTRTTTDRDDNGSIIATVSTRMPASYAYFIALGDSIRTNANWLAIAGSARGVVLNLASDGMKTNIPNGAADAMQPRDGVAVNAITNIKPYGWTIWGNRTLKNNGEKGNLTATSFLNVRNLISDVKKLAYRVARQLTFEQNNDILWVNFKGLIAPTLDRMLTGYGISGYKIVRDTEHEKASEKATVCAKIILYPVYPVEDFYITIVLKDDEISVE